MLRQLIIFIALLISLNSAILHASQFQFGLARIDITPQEPVRLSGYSNRNKPFSGIDEKLYCRALAIKHETGEIYILASFDSIGFDNHFSEAIAAKLQSNFSIPRKRFVLCATHSHTTPQIDGFAPNLFATPLLKNEQTATTAYTSFVRRQIFQAIKQAIKDLAPGTLMFGSGKASFARNRRTLKDGKWAGFGVNPRGPVDHTLPVLKIVGNRGELRGILFNYACHCTTFGGNYNRVNGDWAGYAAQYLEQDFPNAIAICTIGCGADANPDRDQTKALKIAQAQGSEIHQEIKQLISQKLTPINQPLTAAYQKIEMNYELPSEDQLKQQLKSSQSTARRHAENMLKLKQSATGLPVSYSNQLQVWKFGNQLTMVFLGGETVVDYSLRLKREIKSERVWVTAYANDVLGYVASERMRSEGGYEVDRSMIYYNKPGRWATGTEEKIITAVHQLVKQTTR